MFRTCVVVRLNAGALESVGVMLATPFITTPWSSAALPFFD
jgi:hypothetical protein